MHWEILQAAHSQSLCMPCAVASFAGRPPRGARQVYARFYMMVQEQAQNLAYVDTFWLLALIAAIMFGLSFALKKNDPRGAGTVVAH